jgi:hypothetical protein
MINAKDKEKLVKSSQAANLLVQDLRELVNSTDPLLGEFAIEILHQAIQIEQRLNRIGSVICLDANTE